MRTGSPTFVVSSTGQLTAKPVKIKILFVVNELGFFLSHRMPIALEAARRGFEVHLAFGEDYYGDRERLNGLDITVHRTPIERGGTRPMNDLISCLRLLSLFRKLKPNIVHLITIKPVLYGGIAARIAGVPSVVSAMAGLGFLYVDRRSPKTKPIQKLLRPLFFWALGHPNQRVVVQNQDDRDQLMRLGGIPQSKTTLIPGSGVDVANVIHAPEPSTLPQVAMASRLLWDKGVGEFVAAAQILKKRGVRARYLLIGRKDPTNPASVTESQISAWINDGVVEILGHREDVLDLYSKAHIITLPSYREGFPKSLVEAAACGRPVVTTDVPGCRDAIDPGLTGLLIPPRDPEALADALQRLLADRPLREAMGIAARSKAEREFGIEGVVRAHHKIYEELLKACES